MSDYQPPKLTAALDAGIDLTEWPRVGVLAERALTEIPLLPACERMRRAGMELAERDQALEQGDQALATYCQWCADLTEDLTGELAQRFRAAIPDQLRGECDTRLDRVRSPHPLTTGDPCDDCDAAWWKCGNCGTAFDSGHPALTVGDRPGYSDLPYPIHYCPACVTAAASALDVLDSHE
jgi:hypothetical protein